MPDSDPRDGFFCLPLTPMIDPYNLLTILVLTLVLLNPDMLCFANSVDPDQLASEEAN